ncbi:putative acetyltransferase NATA1-like protein [Carex littledalei]|uniref:Putative acetyltransferase NATA1-like protein n=1 Tax=Carex littledalei TaxID=544730 RepID=A0A833R6X3_9POAL|nr:putative acetyltransferase NATA1-like protein [Carex littledalei]
MAPRAVLLYLSFTSPPVPSPQTFFVTQFPLPSPITDPNEADFASPLDDGHVIAGFVNCFSNYSSFLAKPGLYIEQIFVREPWRRKGLGKFMLSAVVKKAAELGDGKG